MAGANPLNQTNRSTQQQPSFSSPGLNTSATFGSASTQNLSFDSNITAGTSLFGSPNVTVSQANLSFGSSTMGTPASNANKSAFGFGFAESTLPASTTGGMSSFGAMTPIKPSFNALSASQPTFGASQPSFNAAASSQPTFGGIVSGQSTFGSAATKQSTFGGAATASLTFGGVAAAQATSGGAAVAQPTLGGATIMQPTFGGTAAAQFSIGGTPAQPALSAAAAAQPSFGTTAAAQPTFGGNSAVQPTFGRTAASAQPTFGGVAATAQSTTGGVISTQPTFGASTTTQQPIFAAITSQPLSFSTPSIQQSSLSTAPTQPLSFGSSTIAPTSSFAAPTTPVVPLFGAKSSAQTQLFGAISTSTISTPSSTLNAPNITSTAPTVSFSTLSTTPSLTFGTVTTTQPTLSFGSASAAQTPSFDTNNSQPISFATPATTQSTSTATSTLSFGATSIVQTTPKLATLTNATSQPVSNTGSSALPGLSASATSATATTSTSGLFGFSSVSGTNSSTTSTPYSWSKTSTVTSTLQTSTCAGLGGIDYSALTAIKSSANTITSVKEQPLPNEIQQTVIAFKEYVKTQKNLSSEIARTSAEPLNKLTQQIASLNNLILTSKNVLLQQKFTTERIKAETIKSLNDYELAQKVKDSPVTSEERLWSVHKYFAEKISSFEENTKNLQERIEYVYKHVMTLPQENSLSAETLKLIMKKLHDSFMVIGAGAYKLHNDLQLLKVQYLTLRNCYIKDNVSISFSMHRELQLSSENVGCKSARSSLEGPNPFSKSASGSFNSLLLTSQNRSLPAGSSKEWASVSANATANPFSVEDVAGNSLLNQKYTLTSPSTNQQFNSPKSLLDNKLGKRQLF